MFVGFIRYLIFWRIFIVSRALHLLLDELSLTFVYYEYIGRGTFIFPVWIQDVKWIELAKNINLTLQLVFFRVLNNFCVRK